MDRMFIHSQRLIAALAIGLSTVVSASSESWAQAGFDNLLGQHVVYNGRLLQNYGSTEKSPKPKDPRSYLLPGVGFGPPLMPLIGSRPVERSDAATSIHPVSIGIDSGTRYWSVDGVLGTVATHPVPERYLAWYKMVNANGTFDFRRNPPRPSLSDSYDQAGNFVYGLTGRQIGIPLPVLKLFGGLFGIFEAAKRLKLSDLPRNSGVGTYIGALSNRLFPYGGITSATFGDKPLDQLFIEMGAEYYDSGQYILDFMSTDFPLNEFSSSREDPFEEAKKRAEILKFIDDDTRSRLRDDRILQERFERLKREAELRQEQINRDKYYRSRQLEENARRERDEADNRYRRRVDEQNAESERRARASQEEWTRHRRELDDEANARAKAQRQREAEWEEKKRRESFRVPVAGGGYCCGGPGIPSKPDPSGLGMP